MNTWEKICEWFWCIGVPVIIISVIAGVIVLGYICHKDFEARYDYKVKIMDSRDGTTYYVKKDEIEIIDGILFIKSNNMTTTTFTITPIEKD